MDFTDLGLESIWSPALATQGIDVPTTIQQRAIPLILQGLDTYVGAETGTGKTLAYLLPLMQRLDASTKSLQVVVLAPHSSSPCRHTGRRRHWRRLRGVRFDPRR